MTTTAIGDPVPSLTVDLEWSDRWVSTEAGSGFSRFDDTNLNLTWNPVPRISLSSEDRYELRDRSDWTGRQTADWTALTGGSVKVDLNVNVYRDTGTADTQKGVGAQFTWAARPSLSFNGGVESTVFTTAGQRNSPVNVDLRGNWRF